MTAHDDPSREALRDATLSLVVPLFNEVDRVGECGQQLVDFVAAHAPGSELLFVDDGSEDDTAAVVEDLIAKNAGERVRLVRAPHLGKGAAVDTGLRAASGRLLGFCDIDLSTPVDQLDRVVRTARRAGVLAIGSRDLSTSTLIRPEGWVREALGRGFNRLVQATLVPGVVDTQCGAKVADRAIWEAVLPLCRERGFAWDVEVIAACRALGIPVQEVPIAWRHDERTRVRLARDGAAMVAAVPRIWRRMRRVRPGPARSDAQREVFDDVNAALLADADADHWWFRSKAAFVSTALRRTDGARGEPGWLVDLGAGAGGVTAMLGWAPDRVLGIDGNHALLVHAQRRRGVDGCRGLLEHLPLATGTVDVVCLLDVIEHLVDPTEALREARRVLRPAGRLVINVPAHQWLWSDADEFLGHKRRYTRPALRQELAVAGFDPVVMTHVFSWLVPPVGVRRRLRRTSGPELGLEDDSRLIERVAMFLTLLERSLIGRVGSPLGTSILSVAVKSERGAGAMPATAGDGMRA